MDPLVNVELSSESKKDIIRRQKRERAKSDLDQELLKQESYHKMRLIDEDPSDFKAEINSDANSVAGSEKLHYRVYRASSLNIERAQEPTPQYKPFMHKELFPTSIQKYISNSQKSRKFVISEAVSKLKVPNSKSHSKVIDKMRLLGLVQEREVDNSLRHRFPMSSTISPVGTPSIDFSPINNEYKEEEFNCSQHSRFLQPSGETNSFGDQNEAAFVHLNANSHSQYQPNDFSQFCLNYQNHSMPQCQNFKGYPVNRLEQLQLPKFHQNVADLNFRMELNNDPYGFSGKPRSMESEIDYCNSYPKPNLRNVGFAITPNDNRDQNKTFCSSNSNISDNSQQVNGNIKDIADQQLVKINKLLVQKPKRLYKLNTIDVPGSYQQSPGINSPISSHSNSSFSNPLSFSNNNAGISNSVNKTPDCSVSGNSGNCLNSLTIDDGAKLGIKAGSEQSVNIAAELVYSGRKKNKKQLYRMNTDPNDSEHLSRTINTTSSPISNSPRHSNNASIGGSNQILPPLSQFSMTNPHTFSTAINMPMPQNPNPIPCFPNSNIGLQRNFQITRLGATPIAETLAENLPSSPKKKVRSLYRNKTDPTELNEIANSVISANPIQYYGMKNSPIPTINSIDNINNSAMSEENKSLTDILNEHMNRMTLKSDCGDDRTKSLQEQCDILPLNNLQSALNNYAYVGVTTGYPAAIQNGTLFTQNSANPSTLMNEPRKTAPSLSNPAFLPNSIDFGQLPNVQQDSKMESRVNQFLDPEFFLS